FPGDAIAERPRVVTVIHERRRRQGRRDQMECVARTLYQRDFLKKYGIATGEEDVGPPAIRRPSALS
ncbi:MAG: hypothetical protein M3423_08955, partial [Actinomycetota bacterium]|nr:hypothetical protein [Actinomycetota bacterium]